MSLLTTVKEQYLEWVKNDTYMVLAKYNYFEKTHTHYAVLCSKRGNLAYKKRILQRFKALSVPMSKIQFFNEKSNEIEYTPCLWVTMTYNTKLKPLSNAWEDIAKEFNRFRSVLTKKYGKVSILRCFEATKNGYPHIHTLLLFHDYLFETKKIYSRQRKRFIWIVKEKTNIAKHWHSNIDIQGVSNMKGSLLYLKKYLSKSIDRTTKANNVVNTLALTWYYHKRSFSISPDLIKYLHNSNYKHSQEVQTDLFGHQYSETKIIFIGIVPKETLFLQKTPSYLKLNDAQIKSVYSWIEQN